MIDRSPRSSTSNSSGSSSASATERFSLELSDDAKRFLVKEGYDPAYGARPLRRVIQREILDPLSLEILDGKFQEGDRISVHAADGHLTFDKT